MRLVEGIVYKAVAVMLVDSGCTEDFARLVVQYGMHHSRSAYRKALRLF